MSVQVVESGLLDGFGIARPEFERAARKEKPRNRMQLKKMAESDRVFGFETVHLTDNVSIRNMLAKVSKSDIITALYGADLETKDAILRNLPEKTRNYVSTILIRLEAGNALEILVERSRNMISEAFIEMLRD
ncbi:MAG TPA: FliG C-terminal domain-containing protein [Candidatus Goldiibacteriota bacterium]|nr:FliG C-terminal domain-containing protein [Candidatus Goldiibacteriota bacterium]